MPTDVAPGEPAATALRSGVRVQQVAADQARAAADLALERVELASPGMSARTLLTRGQRRVLIAVAVLMAASLAWDLRVTVTLIVSVLVAVYLATIAHRAMAVRAALRWDPWLRVSDAQARTVPDEDLPRYTVLVPAYGEPEVMPALIAALEALEYPADRLEVKLLLEEDDDETLAAALSIRSDLDIDILVVPDGRPRTKPRALDYGLAFSSGDLVTIYDAEDRPEPLQLRRAAVAFSRLGGEWACLQARLDFFDSRRNLLTKWFSAEYLTWFNCFLPGMVHQGGVVPLGGTSNHFRRSHLESVGAWDPYNVTEDADLGLRLQRRGFRIGLLDSATLEEANSDTINWVKQRSRWQKGFLQTTFVHLREPRRVWRELGPRGMWHLLLFVGGTPVLALANLVFWSLSLFWIATQAHFIESIFPGPVFYLATAAWIVGNSVTVYLGVLTIIRTGREDLLGAVLLAPLYWVLMSLASARATIQLFVDPHHWEKTVHGLTHQEPAA